MRHGLGCTHGTVYWMGPRSPYWKGQLGGGDFLRSTVRKVQGISGMRLVFSTLFGRWQQRFGARCHCRSNLSLTAARLSGLLPPCALPSLDPIPFSSPFSFFLALSSRFTPLFASHSSTLLVSLSRSSKLTPSHTMLFRKYSVHIGMKVSNRCSIIAVVSLYPSCYPRRNCYFGRKCCVSLVVMVLCRLAKCCDASIFALAAKFHLEPHDVISSSIACIKDSFWFYFSKLV